MDALATQYPTNKSTRKLYSYHAGTKGERKYISYLEFCRLFHHRFSARSKNVPLQTSNEIHIHILVFASRRELVTNVFSSLHKLVSNGTALLK
jgi:hypothetical protein